MRVMTQQMTDMVFSFGELGFQEVETSKYLTGVLEKDGFTIERGVAGIPTAWTARWGSGKPVIALGSDIDDIPQASQKPGVAYHDPIVAGAPGPRRRPQLRPAAATSPRRWRVKRVMEREKLSGTLMLWPGVAEELLGRQGLPGARRRLQGRRRLHLRPRRRELGVRWGEPTALAAWSRSSTRSPARARTRPARRGAAAARSTPSS